MIGDDSEQGFIPGDIFDNHDDDDSIDMEALSKLVPEKVEKSPIELEAEKIEKELDPEDQDFDPLKALEKEIAEEQDTSKKEEKDQSDTSSEDKDKVEAKAEEEGDDEKKSLEPLTHKEFVEMLDESGIKITKKVDGKEVEISASEPIKQARRYYGNATR